MNYLIKKGVLWIVTLLLFVPFVFAQEIDIMGRQVPYIIFIPLAIIVLGLGFFLFVFLRDILSKLNLKLKLKKKKSPRKTKRKDIQNKKRELLRSFRKLKRSSKRLPPSEVIKEASLLTKDLFGLVFKIPHEYTYEELIPKLEKYPKEKQMIQSMSDMIYGGEEPQRLQANLMLGEVENLIHKHLKNIRVPEKEETHVRKIFSLFQFKRPEIPKAPKKVRKLELDLEPPKPKYAPEKKVSKLTAPPKPSLLQVFLENQRNKRTKKEIKDLLKFGRKYLQSPERAMRIYSKALLMYYKLPLKEEKEILDDMASFERDLSFHKEQKRLLELKKEMTELKRKGKGVSPKGINAIKNLTHLIKTSHIKELTKQEKKEEKQEEEIKELKQDIEDLNIELPQVNLEEADFNIKSIKVSDEVKVLNTFKPKKVRKIKLPKAPVEVKQKVEKKEFKLELPKPLPPPKEEKRLVTLKSQKQELYKKLEKLGGVGASEPTISEGETFLVDSDEKVFK